MWSPILVSYVPEWSYFKLFSIFTNPSWPCIHKVSNLFFQQTYYHYSSLSGWKLVLLLPPVRFVNQRSTKTVLSHCMGEEPLNRKTQGLAKKTVQAKSLLPAFTRDKVPPRPPGQREEPVAQPAGGDVSCWHSFRNREMFPFLSVTSRVTE